mmetsp:Transcript_22432/g.48734  ORF Transcript_22432/g.48734 Transcript_22432/m.48734 type:complete len:126 (-) Transcript_22432:190-567(-)
MIGNNVNSSSEVSSSSASSRGEGRKTTSAVCEDNLVCTITRELFFDPVAAEDGFMYENRAIREWIRLKQADGDDVTSPTTNKVMGTTLIPAIQVGRFIKGCIDNGLIKGEAAEKWKARREEEVDL